MVVSGLILTGCSSGDDTVVDIRNAADIGSTTSTNADSPYLVNVAREFPDCEAIGGALAPYTEGLVPAESNVVSSQRVHCTWDVEGEVPPSGITTVEVVIEPETVTSATAAKTGLVTLPDPQIEAAGGFAHSMPINMAGTAVTATGVELPQASVSITVGGRDTEAVLDGPGAVAVAKRLLGI